MYRYEDSAYILVGIDFLNEIKSKVVNVNYARIEKYHINLVRVQKNKIKSLLKNRKLVTCFDFVMNTYRIKSNHIRTSTRNRARSAPPPAGPDPERSRHCQALARGQFPPLQPCNKSHRPPVLRRPPPRPRPGPAPHRPKPLAPRRRA